MIVLREYQEKAVDELVEKISSFLDIAANKKLVFKAPTGSGKTIIIAEALKKLITEENRSSLSFIWAAPRKLHSQSKEKLETYYFENKAIQCSFFEDLQDKTISENEILFLNWESINKEDNIYIRENENDFNLSTVLNNTRDNGNKIVLIIDESHFAADTDISQGLIDMIQPVLTLDISATPKFNGDDQVTVQREHVIRDEMIKCYVVINQGLKNDITKITSEAVTVNTHLIESTNEFIIQEALDKREQIASELKAVGSNVNPLMLVQLPDRKSGLDDMRADIEAILKNKHGITIENGKLAVHLTENKHNLETIKKNDDKVEVLIFKQAIALGWDCPRAYILLMLREMHSEIFTIQTVGRIMRMAELRYYQNDSLNIGYIYTNLAGYTIKEQDSFGYLVSLNSKRKDIYQPINLPSVHPKRFREETRLTPRYIEHFLTAANELNLKDKININIAETFRPVVTDGLIHDIDKAPEYKAFGSETVDIRQNEIETQREFDLFIIDVLQKLSLFPEVRSVNRIKTSIYTFFKINYPLEFEYGGLKEQIIVLHSQNQQFFRDVIGKAKELYFSEVIKGKRELISDNDWNIPSTLNYNNNYVEIPTELCLIEPFYQRNNASTPEKEFVLYLESKKDEIEWWYKNGDSDATNFAVPYVKNEENHAFYIDWIIKYKDGKIGLFDTKSGLTAETAKEKAEGLSKYIKQQNKKGKNLFGGIVVNEQGSWRYNDEEVYFYNPNNLNTWKYLG
jgi:type III restriction enzyme